MAVPKRKRGRPPGTGLDDSGTLRAMAELIVGNTGLKPTAAIKRVGSAGSGDGCLFVLRAWRG